MHTKSPKCAHCKSHLNVVPIQYGYPGVEAWEADLRGELKLGGCEIKEQQWHCKRCEKEF